MSAAPETSTTADDDLETTADQAIAEALMVANNFLETRVARLSVSTGYARGRLDPSRHPEEC